jgi:hypothetical protein
MGYFSWITQDTNKPCKIHRKNIPSKVYYLWDNNGNYWKETSYEGYGVFGNKDYFVLLYEMNIHSDSKEIKDKIAILDERMPEDQRSVGSRSDVGRSLLLTASKRNAENDENEDEEYQNIREKGIEMYYSGDNSIIYPNISESRHWKWINKKPLEDKNQGF